MAQQTTSRTVSIRTPLLPFALAARLWYRLPQQAPTHPGQQQEGGGNHCKGSCTD